LLRARASTKAIRGLAAARIAGLGAAQIAGLGGFAASQGARPFGRAFAFPYEHIERRLRAAEGRASCEPRSGESYSYRSACAGSSFAA
jgi:hypothetical protein